VQGIAIVTKIFSLSRLGSPRPRRRSSCLSTCSLTLTPLQFTLHSFLFLFSSHPWFLFLGTIMKTLYDYVFILLFIRGYQRLGKSYSKHARFSTLYATKTQKMCPAYCNFCSSFYHADQPSSRRCKILPESLYIDARMSPN